MIRAVKSKPFNRIFALYNHYYLLRRRFRSFTLTGSLDPQVDLRDNSPIDPNRPVIYFMNHSSWWDGLLLYHAARQTSRGDHYVMMEEQQLQQYAFFVNWVRIRSIRRVRPVFGPLYSTPVNYWIQVKGSGFFPKEKFCIRRRDRFGSVQALDCCFVAARMPSPYR